MNLPSRKIMTVTVRVLDVLVTKHPARTGIGIVIGGCFAIAATLLASKVKMLFGIDLTIVEKWLWIAPGVLVAHIPTIIWYFAGPPYADEIRMLTYLIDKGDFTEAERRRQYRALIEQIRKSYVISEGTKKRKSVSAL